MFFLANFDRHVCLCIILFFADEAEEMSLVHFKSGNFRIMLDVEFNFFEILLISLGLILFLEKLLFGYLGIFFQFSRCILFSISDALIAHI